MKFLMLSLCAACMLMGCGGCSDNGKDEPVPEPEPTPAPAPEPEPEPVPSSTFAKGADISWVTEMENDGKKFYNAAGNETDCFQLMKDLGMNSIRLRVWVNPENAYGNYSNKADVLAKAKRANDLGLDLMIDFHYSDMFADPGRQDIPKAWSDHSVTALKTAVADHTKEVLEALKAENITPKWVQVGNETRVGMLWPVGQLWNNDGDLPNGWQNYVALSNAGYDAVKAVFDDAIVIIHIDNAWDTETNTWWLGEFMKKGGKYDMIGLSHYPQTNSAKSWSEMNRLAIANITSWASKCNCKMMVCEVGVKSDNETLAAQVLQDFMDKAKATEACMGVFYWEPQVYGGWKPAYYNTVGWGTYDMGAFTAAGKPAKALEAFK